MYVGVLASYINALNLEIWTRAPIHTPQTQVLSLLLSSDAMTNSSPLGLLLDRLQAGYAALLSESVHPQHSAIARRSSLEGSAVHPATRLRCIYRPPIRSLHDEGGARIGSPAHQKSRWVSTWGRLVTGLRPIGTGGSSWRGRLIAAERGWVPVACRHGRVMHDRTVCGKQQGVSDNQSTPSVH